MRHLSVGHAELLRAEFGLRRPIRGNTRPAVTGEEGVASLEIAMRCLKGRAEVEPLHRKGAASGGRLNATRELPATQHCPMNQHARLESGPILFIAGGRPR